MGIDRTRRITFEETAELYNETRPGYPDQLVENVISLSGIQPGGRILEIGCGPGNATIPFAQRGFEILAVELGEKLSALAKENCRQYPKVRIITMAFEEWPVEFGGFDLAISADAFHWIQPEIGYPKVAQALKPSGKIAFFWNSPSELNKDITEAISQVYQSRAPQAVNPHGSFTVDWIITNVTESINRSECFGEIEVRKYPVVETESTDQYIKGLWTFSSHRPVDKQTREFLYSGIREVLDDFGGTITTMRKVVLFMAGKK